MSLSDRITPANVLSYARACITLARSSIRLGQQGYGTMVVPSRGAVPFVQHAQSYRHIALKPVVPREDRFKLLHGHEDPLDVAFHAPFTADMGSTSVADLSTAQVRRFWVKVIAAIVRGDPDDPHYRLYRFTRDKVCRVGHHDGLEFRITSPRFAFVDTVVSGRAVCEIVDAFDAEGLTDVHYLLLIHANGARMKSPYAAKIRALGTAERATLINVDDMFTEDQGPAVSGVWSVVMPSLMDAARAIVPGFAHGAVGAGLYYWEVRARDDESNIHVTRALARQHEMFNLALRVSVKPDETAEDLDLLGSNFSDEMTLEASMLGPRNYQVAMLPQLTERYLEHVQQQKLFDRSSTGTLANARLMKSSAVKASVSVSSSHCLRLDIGANDATSLMRQFKASLAQPYPNWPRQH